MKIYSTKIVKVLSNFYAHLNFLYIMINDYVSWVAQKKVTKPHAGCRLSTAELKAFFQMKKKNLKTMQHRGKKT